MPSFLSSDFYENSAPSSLLVFITRKTPFALNLMSRGAMSSAGAFVSKYDANQVSLAHASNTAESLLFMRSHYTHSYSSSAIPLILAEH